MNVFIVNDSDQLSQELIATFVQEGIAVTHSNDPLNALDLIIRQKPDIIVMDLCIHNWEGLDFCRILKTTESTKDIPVTFYSSNSRSTYLGFIEHLENPVDVQKLLLVLKEQSIVASLQESWKICADKLSAISSRYSEGSNGIF